MCAQILFALGSGRGIECPSRVGDAAKAQSTSWVRIKPETNIEELWLQQQLALLHLR